jgi:hypothetical protein
VNAVATARMHHNHSIRQAGRAIIRSSE